MKTTQRTEPENNQELSRRLVSIGERALLEGRDTGGAFHAAGIFAIADAINLLTGFLARWKAEDDADEAADKAV
jgi:hypothetical protein